MYLTSGVIDRPHRVIGFVQMTQSGYKWMHEVELVDDAQPESLLFRIGDYARKLGAHGVQHLQVVDLNPQTPAETASKKIDSVVRMARALEKKQYAPRPSGRSAASSFEYFIVVPVIGVLAMPLQALLRPWAKRRRLRKYLARTTPSAKP